MIKNYIIRKVLTEDKIKELIDLIDDQSNVWVDGLQSTFNMDNRTKNNIQLSQKCDNYHMIKTKVMESIDCDNDFYNFTQPHTSTAPVVSKYGKGSYYNIHEDDPNMGKYSTTIFLSDPSTYLGGELCLYINDKEEKFKLPSGYAITYPTGILHKVNKVEEGERKVIVFWTTSTIKEDFFKDVINDLNSIRKSVYQILNDNKIDKYLGSDFKSYEDDPINRLSYTINKIKRYIQNQ